MFKVFLFSLTSVTRGLPRNIAFATIPRVGQLRTPVLEFNWPSSALWVEE